MGGPGSGNDYCHWWRPPKKGVVEDCLSLDANRWAREGILKAGVYQTGSSRWVYPGGRECSLNYEVHTLEMDRPLLRLSYNWTRGGGERGEADYQVRLTTTRPRFGGLRWWFVCPLLPRGAPCGRRVGKLYLPPGGRYFGCRHCHDLTYTSAQKHDKRVDALRRDPDALRALLEDEEALGTSKLLLALKALRWGQD
jgi:hypothetical protein